MSRTDDAKQAAALVYAVRPLAVLRQTGRICAVLALLSVVPLAVAAFAGEIQVAGRYAIVVGILATITALSRRVPVHDSLQINEALVITAIAFLLASVLLALPLQASGLSASSAVFEAVSAVTTTGLSAAEPDLGASFVFAFGRAWAQWYGGLGIVVLSLALIAVPGAISRQLVGDGGELGDLAGSTRSFARASFRTYAALTVAGIVLLIVFGARVAPAVLHTLAAVSTGGFSPYRDSLASAPGWLERYAVILLCVLGAVPLVEYRLMLQRRAGTTVRRIQMPSLTVAIAVSVAALSAALYWVDGMTASSSLAHGLFVGASAQTTAGFTTLEIGGLSSTAKIVLIASMLVGGGVGSTAGGIKILRLLVFLRVAQVLVRRTCLPRHAVLEPRLGGDRLETNEIQFILSLIVLFVVVLFASWIPFVVCGYDPVSSLFEVASALGTVGLSTGISSPGLPMPLKAVLCADMLLGRLEIVAFLVLLYPRTWFGRRLETQ
jgi:trk system potassium uptake protein TrkH